MAEGAENPHGAVPETHEFQSSRLGRSIEADREREAALQAAWNEDNPEGPRKVGGADYGHGPMVPRDGPGEGALAGPSPTMGGIAAVARERTREARFRTAKANLRGAFMAAHHALSDGAPWSEADDAVLDAATAWLVGAADRTNPSAVPHTTRVVVERVERVPVQGTLNPIGKRIVTAGEHG